MAFCICVRHNAIVNRNILPFVPPPTNPTHNYEIAIIYINIRNPSFVDLVPMAHN